MTEWTESTLGTVMTAVDVRNRDSGVSLVLSVTEGRGIIPQTEVFKKRIATDDTSKYKIIEPLDIAWNPYLLWTGAIGQWLGDGSGVTSPVYPVYRCHRDQDARFWGLVLESGRLTPYFDSRAIGSIQRRRRTTPEVFTAAPVEVPPLPTQERIVEVIGAVDDQIAALDAEATSGAAVRAALVADLLAGADETWKATTLGSIATLSIGRTPDRKNSSYWTTDTSYPFCTIADMPVESWSIDPQREGVTDAAIRDGKAKLAPAGSLLMSFKLTIGRVGFAERDVYPNEAIVRIEPSDSVSSRFLALWLESHDLTGNAPRAVKGKTLNSKSLAAIRVLLPERAVQDVIADTIKVFDQRIAATRAETERLRAVRASLLSGLLTPPGEAGHINVETVEKEAVGG